MCIIGYLLIKTRIIIFTKPNNNILFYDSVNCIMSFQCRICHAINEPSLTFRFFGTTRATRKETYSLYKCSWCESLNAIDSVLFDQIYQDYPLKHQRYDFFTNCLFKSRLSLLKELGLKKEHSILDFGCGSGLFVKFLLEKGFQAKGYDPYNILFSDNTFRSQKFDYVISQDVFEHFDSPRDFISEVKTIVKESGKIVIGFPFSDYIDLKKSVDIVGVLHQPFHRFIPSKRGVLHFFEDSDLVVDQVLDRNYMDTIFPFANSVFLFHYFISGQGCLDIGFEPIKISHFIKNPWLLFWGLFGYFFKRKQFLLVSAKLKKTAIL